MTASETEPVQVPATPVETVIESIVVLEPLVDGMIPAVAAEIAPAPIEPEPFEHGEAVFQAEPVEQAAEEVEVPAVVDVFVVTSEVESVAASQNEAIEQATTAEELVKALPELFAEEPERPKYTPKFETQPEPEKDKTVTEDVPGSDPRSDS